MESRNNVSQRTKNSDCLKTLQHVPLEMLDMILMKAVLHMLRVWRRSHLCPAVDQIQEQLELLMTVWSEWHRRLNTRWFKIKLRRLGRHTLPPVWKMGSVDQEDRTIVGVTKLRNRIYVLCIEPTSIYVYEDHGEFRLINTISFDETIPIFCSNPIHAGVGSDCLYFLEAVNEQGLYLKAACKTDPEGKNVTRWMNDLRRKVFVMVMDDDNVMIAKDPSNLVALSSEDPYTDDRFKITIEIYRPDAVLIRSFSIPYGPTQRIVNTVQTRQETFIVSQEYAEANFDYLYPCTDYSEVVIQIDKNGQQINKLDSEAPMPTKEITKFMFQSHIHISLDKRNNKLFATNYTHLPILVIDPESLRWIESVRLLSSFSRHPSSRRAFPMYLDSERRQLIARNYGTNHLNVYRVL